MSAQYDRREFLKRLAGLGVRLGVAGTVLGSLLLGRRSIEIEDKTIVDTTIKDIPFKLHGIAHCRAFAEKYYGNLDRLVRDASMVVSEGDPDSHNEMTKNGSVYFGTIEELCRKYRKPIVYLDSNSTPAAIGEFAAGTIGFLLAMHYAGKMVTESSTKRKFIKNSLKTAAGFYLLMSSFLHGISLKTLVNKNYDRRERFYYSHITDQRNVEVANRLLRLPDMLEQDDFSDGKYVLVEYGKAHIAGIMQYLKSPVWRRIKTAMYKLTYDLVDSERIVLYKPKGKSCNEEDFIIPPPYKIRGEWERKILYE